MFIKQRYIDIHIVTDNAPNIVKAISLNDEWHRVACFAHCLQLVIKHAIRESDKFNTIVKKCKGIVGFFKKSTAAASELYKLQEKQDPENMLKLIQCVGTRNIIC